MIVPALDAADTIGDQLDALERQRETGTPWEVLIVDNGCTDDTVSIAETYCSRHSNWRVVPAHREHNLAYARNVGVHAASGVFVAFADADDVVADQWAQAVVAAVRAHPLVAFAFEYDRLNSEDVLAGRSRFQSRRVETIFDLPVASGPLAVRRDIWLEVGGNDELWSFTGEDFDFALRVRHELGIEPTFADEATYHYRLRPDARGTFKQARRYGRGHAALFACHVNHRPSIGERAKESGAAWWWILSRAPLALMQPERRRRWARQAGIRVGRLIGSVRERTFCP